MMQLGSDQSISRFRKGIVSDDETFRIDSLCQFAHRDEFVRDSDQQLLAFAFDQITSVCVVRILILRPCFRLHKKRNVTDLLYSL